MSYFSKFWRKSIGEMHKHLENEKQLNIIGGL